MVTGAGGNASQNFVASLRMAAPDAHVVGCDTAPYHLQAADVAARYLVSPCREPGYIDQINRIVERESVDLIHPQPDVEVQALSAARRRLAAALFLPADDVVVRCADKQLTHEALAAAGVASPASRQLDSFAELEAAIEAVRTGPRVWVRATRGAGSRAALPVETADQAASWIRYWVELKGLSVADFMVAEFLPGREFAFQSLWHDGELVTSMARERLEYVFGNLMPSGQSSSPSIAMTVHEPAVNEVGAAAVRAVSDRPSGVFCVDLKCDGGGAPKVTEINCGRFFTTNNFFSAAGANMPYDYVCLGLGRSIPERPRFDALDAGLYWIRGMDRAPVMVRDGELDAIDVRGQDRQ